MDATRSSAVEGVDAAISAWVADECDLALGQELPPEDEDTSVDLVATAKNKAMSALAQFRAIDPIRDTEVQKKVVSTR